MRVVVLLALLAAACVSATGSPSRSPSLSPTPPTSAPFAYYPAPNYELAVASLVFSAVSMAMILVGVALWTCLELDVCGTEIYLSVSALLAWFIGLILACVVAGLNAPFGILDASYNHGTGAEVLLKQLVLAAFSVAMVNTAVILVVAAGWWLFAPAVGQSEVMTRRGAHGRLGRGLPRSRVEADGGAEEEKIT